MDMIPNGGRSFTLGGRKFDVISGYSPSWTKETVGEFVDYAGKYRTLYKGVRFSLKFSAYGMLPADVAAIKSILMDNEEIQLVCGEYTGAVTCEAFSPDVKSSNFLGDYSRTDITLTAVNIIEGGKIVSINNIEFVVTENYTPTWTNEYADTFTDYQGHEVKLSKGVRFSLTFSVKGVPPAVLMQIENVLMNPGENGITLTCSEYSGEVTCDSFSASLQTASSLGEYFAPNITVQAVNIIEGGKAVTLGGVNFVVREGYSPAWSKEYAESFTTYDGRVIKPLKGVRFSLSFSPKGIPPEVLTTLRDNVAYTEKVLLTCPEFTGDVICETLSADLQHASTLGEYFGAGINLTAVNAELPEDGL